MQKLESQVLLVIKPEILIRNAKDLYCFKTNKFETTYKLIKLFFHLHNVYNKVVIKRNLFLMSSATRCFDFRRYICGLHS